MAKEKDIRQFRRSNKTQILWFLYNKGPLSRLELAKLCKLTTPSITQLINDLTIQKEVVEVGSIQRNATGRKEILLDLNPNKTVVLGINIETDYTYFCIANVKKVFNVIKVKTEEFDFRNTAGIFTEKIAEILAQYPKVNQICVGVNGKVENGCVETSYDDVHSGFNMQKHLEEKFNMPVEIINNIKAQALSLYKMENENYMFITHSPELGSAMIIKGELIKGNDKVTGELGHTIIKLDGKQCKCGKRGCINTYVSDEAIEEEYFNKTGIKKSVDEIYELYEIDEVATEILKRVIRVLAVLIANVSEMLNPERVFLSGGIFAQDKVYDYGWEILDKCGYKGLNVERIVDIETLKSTAVAKYSICKNILSL